MHELGYNCKRYRWYLGVSFTDASVGHRRISGRLLFITYGQGLKSWVLKPLVPIQSSTNVASVSCVVNESSWSEKDLDIQTIRQ